MISIFCTLVRNQVQLIKAPKYIHNHKYNYQGETQLSKTEHSKYSDTRLEYEENIERGKKVWAGIEVLRVKTWRNLHCSLQTSSSWMSRSEKLSHSSKSGQNHTD